MVMMMINATHDSLLMTTPLDSTMPHAGNGWHTCGTKFTLVNTIF